METKFQTSFIPKQPVTETRVHSSGGNFFFLVSFILFMVSVAIAGAAFLYDQLVENNISKGNAQLRLNENAFDSTTIQQLTRLNDRINAAQNLLRQHIAFSNFFGALERATLRNVVYKNFSYAYGGGEKISISMLGLAGRGPASSYETVALQAKAFTDPSLRNVFRSPILTDVALDAQGNASFSFSASIDPILVSFYRLRKEEAAAAGAVVDTDDEANSPQQ
ncbi:MAG: hypothetical protein V4664_02475 [Patescibacteria group bacterium]